jgi:methane/ammonia monooxygenase subunit C
MAQPQSVRPQSFGSHEAQSSTIRSSNPTDWLIGWKSLFWGCALVMAANLFLWFWDYEFAFTAGLNSASHEFTLYYRSLFWGELIVLGVFTGIWYGWLIRTGREVADQPYERSEEVRRIAVLWSIIGVTSLSIYIEASFWPNWDGSWHQTMVRDTALTPTHIPMFYFFFPLSVVLALGAYLYGMYRIPALYSRDKGFPWSFFLLISAAVLECMEVAFNEWGHSLWISEEFFAVPFHWPFVAYGWLASGMFAVWGETILRLFEIEKAEEEANAVAPSRPHVAAD